MANHHLRNQALSLKAKGLLSLMLSLPENWDYTTKGLSLICKDGVDSICSTIKELEAAGYIRRRRLRDAKGLLTKVEYIITEEPYFPAESPNRENPVLDNPVLDSPVQAKPEQEKPAQSNTNQSNTKESNTYGSNTNPILSVGCKPTVLRSLGQNRSDKIAINTEAYRELIMENIDYDVLQHDMPEAQEQLEEILNLMVDIVTTARTSIRVADLALLPVGEREILLMIARQVLRAFSESHMFMETTAVFDCSGFSYTARGKTVKTYGWRLYDKSAPKELVLPELKESMELKVRSIEVRDGQTKPPAHYTEDTLLSAMESAGKADMPEDAERQGLGTPATRSGIIEKLIAIGFVERKKGHKHCSLIPCSIGTSLVTVLPEQLQSPLLTAEWEYKLKQVERGELDPDAFMAEISLMVNDLVKTCQPIPGAEILFPSGRDVIGTCPRCGSDVTESKKGYFCERNDCRFGLWRDNKFLIGKKISLNPKMVAALLKGERVPVKGIFSERTGKSYDAALTLSDDGSKSTYALDFEEDANA